MSEPTAPVAFQDLPEDCFPFTMTLFDPDTGKELWRETVEGPGAVRIPGFGYKMRVRIEYGNGSVVDTGSDSAGG